MVAPAAHERARADSNGRQMMNRMTDKTVIVTGSELVIDGGYTAR
jgi:hypothetical protein